jgi:hypothetical protein
MIKKEIRYLKHYDINKAWWDDCLQSSPQATAYAQAWYLDRVAPEWEALVIDSDNGYEAILPIPVRRKWGIQYVFPPYFTQQLGLFARPALYSAALQNEFINVLSKRFRWIYYKLHINSEATVISGIKGALWERGITHHLTLQKTYPELRTLYATNHKRNIAKAAKAGYSFDIERAGAEALIRLYIADKGTITSDIKEEHYQVLISLFEEGYIREQALLATATTAEGKLAAGIIFIKFKSKVIYLFAASSAEGKKAGSMAWLVDKCIQLWAEQELTLDFEGSSVEGIARFYKGFGAEPVYFPIFKANRLPAIIRLIKK